MSLFFITELIYLFIYFSLACTDLISSLEPKKTPIVTPILPVFPPRGDVWMNPHGAPNHRPCISSQDFQACWFNVPVSHFDKALFRGSRAASNLALKITSRLLYLYATTCPDHCVYNDQPSWIVLRCILVT